MDRIFENIEGKTILVTGGTGSFGNALLDSLDDVDVNVIVYSRDENKQHAMFIERNNKNVRYVIGDVRDREKLRMAMRGVDYVFHAAALKHVPTGEQFPEEVIATNVTGTRNVLDMAEATGVKKVINISTDKAVEPINAYGMTKALAEKLVNARDDHGTTFVNLRYGNVLGSRGSFVPLFLDQIARKKPITITEAQMTRFLMPLRHALLLVNKCVKDGKNGDLFVIRSPAATVETVVAALEMHFDLSLERKIIGIRPGEKMHEVLLNAEEARRAHISSEAGITYSRIAKKPAHINDFFQGDVNGGAQPFTSETTERYDVKQTLALLREAELLS